MKNSILWAGPADQKRGTGVVCRMIGRNLTGRKIGVAVSAAARAGVVDADVHTGRAAAFRTLPFGGNPVQRLPKQRFKQRSVHAASMGNACRTQIQCLGAALHAHAAAGGNFGNSAGKAGGDLRVKGCRNQRPHSGTGTPVFIQKADHTGFGVSLQATGNLFEAGQMPVFAVLLGKKMGSYRQITRRGPSLRESCPKAGISTVSLSGREGSASWP